MCFISNYTPIFEDLAYVMDANLPVEDVTPIILETGGPCLKNATSLDVYEGEQVVTGKKFSLFLTFQATDRILTDDEVEIRNKIIKRRKQISGNSRDK